MISNVCCVSFPSLRASGPGCVLRVLQPNPPDLLGPLFPGGDADQQYWLGGVLTGNAGVGSLAPAAAALPQHLAAPQDESTAGHPESP